MFITRKRLEEIKQAARWERERELYRDREMDAIYDRLFKLESKVARLESGEDACDCEPPIHPTCL